MSGNINNRIPSVAQSDLVLCVCSFGTALMNRHAAPWGAAGAAVLGCAAFLGVVRFGAQPRAFKKPHMAVAAAAGVAGLPLVSLELASRLAWVQPLLLGGAVPKALLALGAVTPALPAGAVGLATSVNNGVGLLLSIVYAIGARDFAAGLAIVCMMVGGAVGPKFDESLYGVKKVDVLHYLFAVGMLAYGASFAAFASSESCSGPGPVDSE